MRSRPSVKCELCGQEISKSNYSKHLRRHENNPDSFNRVLYKTDHDGTVCKFCGKDLPTRRGLISHESCCKLNPDRKLTAPELYSKEEWRALTHHSDRGGWVGWNKGLTKETDLRVKKQSDTCKARYASGEIVPSFLGKKHSEETKQKLRQIAISRGLGGHPYRKNIVYKGYKFDSSLELLFAKRLDALEIEWEQCSRFDYLDPSGKRHSYTPDFYLPQYDLYFDPKNDYLINNVNPALGFKDVEKIQWVMEQNNIKVFILNEEDILNFNIQDYVPS